MAKNHYSGCDMIDLIGDGTESELSWLSDEDDIDEDNTFPTSELENILNELEEAEFSVFKPIESDDDSFMEVHGYGT